MRTTLRTLALAAALLVAPAAGALEYFDGRIQAHGYVESQFRSMSDGFRNDRWFVSQWAQVLTLELEAEIFPDGIGPFDSVELYVRGQARFDCIWSKLCGTMRSAQLFGNRSVRAPGNLANGVEFTYSGITQIRQNPAPAQNANHNLIQFQDLPSVQAIIGFGAGRIDQALGPINNALYTTKRYDGSLQSMSFNMGPWQPKVKIHPVGQLGQVQNNTGPLPNGLPLRPRVPNRPELGLGGTEPHNLYIPSQALVERLDELDSFDQNFTQSQLQWNRGASQEQTKELKEAYLDIEMLEGRLFLRLGKQTIVWGKTELFPVVDQFNPYDFALTTLPSLEDSRIPLWSARAIYSLYDVGPLEDVRVELGVNLDRFQPNDLGKCGEPYSPWLVCGKSFGLLAHGAVGLGLAGEQRPADFWENSRGLEFGGRIEFRWDRFSFALTDYYGYSDFPFVNKFNAYERRVSYNTQNPFDPNNGRPLDVDGNFLTPANALKKHPGNRQLFDFTCTSTGGLAANLLPALANDCFLDLLNSNVPVAFGVITVPQALGPALAGNAFGSVVLNTLTNCTGGPNTPRPCPVLDELNRDQGDGPYSPVDNGIIPFNVPQSLTAYLTQFQQSLLGCGPFYGTSCDLQGIDLFNAEASVLLQAFPQFEGGGAISTRFLEQRQGPVATRYVNGQLVTLPGARTLYDPDYDPLQDGCVANEVDTTAFRVANGLPVRNASACAQVNSRFPGFPKQNLLAKGFTNELQALSANFLKILGAFGQTTQASCNPNNPITCDFVTAFFQAAGTQRPEMIAGGNGRYGRRDFAWSSGAEGVFKYRQRNVLGLSTDFAEDVTKTNWSVEVTWVNDDAYENTTDPNGFSFADGYNFVVSVDRPTFINFLNPGRTFLFNMQWFFGYVPDYKGQGVFTTNGPYSQLGTFTILTGYFQDRLLPSLTFVHDVGSNSGAILGQVTYRFSEAFSATIGISNFYGSPQFGRIPLRQFGLQNNGGNFEERFRFNGLSAVAEREEISAILRYTF